LKNSLVQNSEELGYTVTYPENINHALIFIAHKATTKTSKIMFTSRSLLPWRINKNQTWRKDIMITYSSCSIFPDMSIYFVRHTLQPSHGTKASYSR